MKEFRNPSSLPTLFNPLVPFPTLEKASFRVQWNKASNLWPEVAAEESLLYPTPWPARLCSFINNPHPCAPSLGAQGSWAVQLSQTCSTFLLLQEQAACQSSGHLGFAHMPLTRKRHCSSICLSASCRSAGRSYKCICTTVKFSLTFCDWHYAVLEKYIYFAV